MIRVLIADDSAVQREYLAHLLSKDSQLAAVGVARDGVEVIDLAERLKPDVIVMDVYMPRANGFEATRRIMERSPVPIVMATTGVGKDEVALTFQALSAGALAIVEKPGGASHPGCAEDTQRLLETVKLMAEVKVVRRWPLRDASAQPQAPRSKTVRRVQLIAIGASTGGPQTIASIFSQLPASLAAPILIVQHITPGFIQGMAEWLDRVTQLTVKVAEPGELARAGSCYLAPNGLQLGITKGGRIHLAIEPSEDTFCPSVSYLFRSVAEALGPSAMGILLTGMGGDGAVGLGRLREAGGVTVAQDETSCIIFGMPAQAIKLGAAEYVMSPERIAGLIRSLADGGGQ